MPKLKIYSDNAIEAAWFKNLHPRFGDVTEALILSRGQNTPVINDLIHYDRPDIILSFCKKLRFCLAHSGKPREMDKVFTLAISSIKGEGLITKPRIPAYSIDY
jgi:hypothetical protein